MEIERAREEGSWKKVIELANQLKDRQDKGKRGVFQTFWRRLDKTLLKDGPDKGKRGIFQTFLRGVDQTLLRRMDQTKVREEYFRLFERERDRPDIVEMDLPDKQR